MRYNNLRVEISVMLTIEEIRECINPILKEYHLRGAVLYASYKDRKAILDRDFDILVEESLSDEIKFNIIEKIRPTIDYTLVNMFEIERIRINDYRYYRDALKYGVLLYGQVGFIKWNNRIIKPDKKKGVYSIDDIQDIAIPVLKKYNIKGAVLFGSYAKGTANEDSDVDLIVDGEIGSLALLEIKEELAKALDLQKVDVLRLKSAKLKDSFYSEIKKYGVLIYGTVGEYQWNDYVLRHDN